MLMTTKLFFYNKLYFIFWKYYPGSRERKSEGDSAYGVGKIHLPIFLNLYYFLIKCAENIRDLLPL